MSVLFWTSFAIPQISGMVHREPRSLTFSLVRSMFYCSMELKISTLDVDYEQSLIFV